MKDSKKGSRTTEEVRERIRALRIERRLTQAELCELAGISIDAVTRIERGSRVPTLETLEKLAAAFHVRLIDLLGQAAEQQISTTPAVRRIATRLQRQPAAIQDLAADLVQAFLKAVAEAKYGARPKSSASSPGRLPGRSMESAPKQR
jgi:transcriptional regulator with XRE-family HTH domain